MSKIEEIESALARRRKLLKSDPKNKEIDGLRLLVTDLLKKNQDGLPVEFILESLSHLGDAPSILYDDNGHWTVGGDGSQNLLHDADLKKETTFDATWWIGPNRWRKSIRDAVRDHLAER